MDDILERFEEHVHTLEESLHNNATYEQRFQQRNFTEEIQQEQAEIEQLIRQLKSRASVLQKLQLKQTTFITEHPHLPVFKVREILNTRQTLFQQQWWKKYIQLNHSIKITVEIAEIDVFMRQWGNIENELPFQRFRMHLHHVDKRDTSRYMRYHPNKGMFHLSGMVDNKMIKNDKQIFLSVQHVIRYHNCQLYSDLFEKESITLVAQSRNGYVIATAQIDFSQVNPQEAVKRMPICLKFAKSDIANQQHVKCQPIFYAKCYLTIESTPLPPEIQELNKNYQSQLKQRSNSRSPSPNRIISMGTKSKEKSPKKKRQLVSRLISPQQNRISISIFQLWDYKYKLSHLNLSVSRQLIYKNVVNIREKKVELVKIGDEYYFKLFASKENSKKPALLVFSFNLKEYEVHVLPNNLFQKFKLQDYKAKSKVQRKDSQLLYNNCLVDLGKGNLVYARQHNRIQKSLANLQIESGLLGTLFVRSILTQCQIYCSKPFRIVETTKKQDGFMLTYRFQEQIAKEVEQLLIVYLSSELNDINQMHVFDCRIEPRKVTRQSLYKEVYSFRGQVFIKVSLKMIVNENSRYEIESADNSKLRVVNGCGFEYRNGSNQYVILQVMGDLPLISDLLFRDSKNRSFFMRICVKEGFQQT